MGHSARRRADEQRMKAKAKRVFKDHPKATRYADHLKTCSCFMCGNPRKWFREPTVQEKRYGGYSQ